MAQEPTLAYATPVSRRIPRRLYGLYVFGGMNLLAGACLLLTAVASLAGGRPDEAAVSACIGAIVAATGSAQLLHRRVTWALLVGLQLAILGLTLFPLLLATLGFLAAEIEYFLPVFVAIASAAAVIPLGYLFSPGVRRAFR